jgi:hypothetical protein
MPTVTCPSLSVEEDLMRELREVAEALHLSPDDVHRQALRLGLPQVRARRLGVPAHLLEPFPAEELDRYYSRPEDEPLTAEQLHAALPKEEPR